MTREQPPVRPDPLAEAASRRHELTRSKAIQTLRELDRAGTPVTFAAVAQAAGRLAIVALYPARHQRPDPPAAEKQG
jgi:negative regulator of sigma E activity